ncbi:hypothetical protein [Pseudalkalibacillus caeni]|uniref:Uncharacterized protein n=1 Tax=Exobacillus caeni TaxID=2574798 RepID=A0A5R9FHH3_9BACL|nr:hypothetical protein [Pseudalkalibacillus caeni]TLS39015.1 hypothetical protein FCL54_01520 [Pseudalkalibacillus caeni]
MEKRTYYITPKGDIFEQETETQLNQFEIEADYEEYTKLKMAINEMKANKQVQQHDFFSTAHFHEEAVDKDRQLTDNAIYDLYTMIYQLGTSHTKYQIEKMGILPRLKENLPEYRR